MALKEWDGRQACTVALNDSYPASSAAVPIMGVAYIFTKGVTDPKEPEAQSKVLALTYLEASSLADGRFTVTPKPAEPAESKTEKAAKPKKTEE